MKIALLMQDKLLEEGFRNGTASNEDELVFFEQPEALRQEGKDTSWDVMVVSDRFFDFPAFCEFVDALKEQCPSAKFVFMLSNRHDAEHNQRFVKYGLTNGIFLIHPGLTIPSIVHKAHSYIYGDQPSKHSQRNKVVLFMGSTPNLGTTFVSFGTAVRVAAETNQNIAYVCLNLKSSKIHKYMGVDEPVTTLDSIRADLKAQGAVRERWMRYFEPVKGIPNLHVLYGNMLREQAEFFTPEDMIYVLEMASNCFDLCIVEVNAYWDNAATICGIMYADTKIIVTSKEMTQFQEDINRWNKSMSGMFGVEPSSFDIFINQSDKSAGFGGISAKDIRKETGMPIIGEMRKHPQAAEYLNRGKIVELFMNDPLAIYDLSGLAHTLIGLYGLGRKPSAKGRQPWLRKILSKANAT